MFREILDRVGDKIELYKNPHNDSGLSFIQFSKEGEKMAIEVYSEPVHYCGEFKGLMTHY